ncbi:two-component system, sensor histidine kinase YesM [Anaerocolumna jejuensis DSM 15929]|uniref:Two-component system, sensor histidine kinase YesM n=1 Tax=Anaerocolumna jejuensis DSM 15929 TaxID=1121322 RepID=A0A1M7AGR4_9FIRM|nr:histidine kinase [Anaerocolumna jejuensis]SHL41948.1 two-component system, sensor histidine kinase YesM [Anaerocolumna jejuensis DSM 15929]
MTKRIRDLSIQSKIQLICIIIASGVVLISFLAFYQQTMKNVMNTAKQYMNQYISFSDSEFTDMLNKAKRLCLTVAMDQQVISPVLKKPSKEASFEDYQEKKMIGSYLSGLLSNEEYINYIAIITDKYAIYTSEGTSLYLKDIDKRWYQETVKENKLKVYLLNGKEKGIVLCRPIIYKQKSYGIVIVRMDYDSIIDIYDTEVLKDVDFFIFSAEGKLFYQKNSPLLNKDNETEVNALYRNSQKIIHLKGRDYYYIEYQSRDIGTKSVSLIPVSRLTKDANKLRIISVIIMALSILVILVISKFLSGKICKDIQLLNNCMKKVEEGDLQIRAVVQSEDEIGKVTNRFNQMMDQISMLVQEVQVKEEAKREAQLNALEAQIQPHFLYNTLASMQHVASMRHETEIEEVANALSELLRSVLNNRNEYVTLWEEYEYIENFIKIENFKFRNHFEIIWDVEEEIWLYHLPKLIIQPIVENSIIHGIVDMEKGGVINIKAYRNEEFLLIQVIDNGRGISKETIEKLEKEIKRNDKLGFRQVGIANVFNRIRLLYGERYGGTIYSYENAFTCIEMRFPKQDIKLKEG